MEILLKAQAPVAASGQALQRYVGGERTVSRPHKGIAGDPIADNETRRVRSDGAHAANRPGSRRHGQLEKVFSLAAEHFVRIRQNTRRHDIDHHLSSTEDRIGQGLDREWRSERLQNCCSHRGCTTTFGASDPDKRPLRSNHPRSMPE